jgi:hypothetical protein
VVGAQVMEPNKNMNWKMNELIDAILEELAESERVVRLLHDLKTKNPNKNDLSLLLELKINDILSFTHKKVAPEIQPRNRGDFRRQPDPPKEGSTQFIDGKKLSEMEVKFQEWCVNRFNEKKWLDSLRIRF